MSTVVATVPGAAAPARHIRRHIAARRHVPSPKPTATGYGEATTPPFVYGASAPYYVFGKGGGDEDGNDPIGGPDHVGNGGPAVVLGGNFRGLTTAEARRAAGWPGY